VSRRLKLLIECALAAALVVGVSGFARSDSAISLSVDGDVQTVESHASTVADLLVEQDVALTDRDLVQPDPATVLDGVDQVVVRHARPIQVVVDGQPTQLWTTELTVEAALAQVGVTLGDAEVAAPGTEQLPLSGSRVGVRMPDQVTVLADQRRTTLVTTAGTVSEVLQQAGVRLGRDDLVNIGLRHRVETGQQIVVTRVDTRTRTDRFRIRFPVVRRADDSRYEGYRKVITAGRAGAGVKVTKVVRHDGVVVAERAVSRRVVREPKRQVVVYGTKPRPYAASGGASGLNWAALAQCESGGNPRAVNAAGYYGLYQFSLSTWASVGGSGNPIDASPEEQTYRAQVLFSRSGAGPWPVCGPLLFS
jgi:uncharacterized protein YabE (DUF348 family)